MATSVMPGHDRAVEPTALEPSSLANYSSLPNRLRRDPAHTMVTLVIDSTAAAAAVAIGVWWADLNGAQTGWYPWLFVPILLLVLTARSMYRRSMSRSFLDEVGPVETSVALAAMVLLTALLLLSDQGRPGEVTVRIWVLAAALVAGARLARAAAQRVLRKRFHSAAPALIVGSGPISHQIIKRMQQMPEYGMQPVGILCRQGLIPSEGQDTLDFLGVPRLGNVSDLASVVQSTRAEELILAFLPTADYELVESVRTAHRLGMRVWVVPRLFDAMGVDVRIEHLGGLPLLVLPHVDPRGWQFVVKDVFDRVFAAIGLIVISPVLLGLALLVRLSSPGPILFAQKRVGRDGQPFDCYKFRSMRPPRPSDAHFRPESGSAPGGVEGIDRRTTIGRIMRRTSLDELPQLLNVLKGDMSMVGPRPERPEFVELFEAQIRRYGERHRVKAGMTGWAQVHGLRGQTSIADRAEWDNYYIENWSLWLDIKILFLTVLAVMRRSED